MSAVAEKLEAHLRQLPVPGVGLSVDACGALARLTIKGGHVEVTLRAAVPGECRDELADLVAGAVRRFPDVTEVSLLWEPGILGRTIDESDPVPQALNIILIMSGKGGVGKSTVAANLALSLRHMGARVGLLDADIYGPSIPTMFGVTGPIVGNGQKLQPLERHGIELMSIGFLLEDPRSAVIWRGPMIQSALMQLLTDVAWSQLDYLLLDLPPGTGDIALTLSQRLQCNGSVIVTTPQEVALQDVYKSVAMNRKVGIPVLGVVENESYFVCDGCSKRHELFGQGGGAKVAEMADAPLLGQIPVEAAIRQAGDAGTPVVEAAPDSAAGREFLAVAERLAREIARQNAENAAGLTIDRSGGINRHLPIAR